MGVTQSKLFRDVIISNEVLTKYFSKKELTRYSKNIKHIELEINKLICTTKNKKKITKIFVLMDVSMSMGYSNSRLVLEKFLDDTQKKCNDHGIELIVVPFGAYENELYSENYSPQTYEHFKKNSVDKDAWSKFQTYTWLLRQFLDTDFNNDPYGFIFTGDGRFTDCASNFINALKKAANNGKLTNCAFLHFLYFYSRRKYVDDNDYNDYNYKNNYTYEYLKKNFLEILKLEKTRTIPYSEGLDFSLSNKINFSSFPQGFYGIGKFGIDLDLYPQTIAKLVPKYPGILQEMIVLMTNAMITDYQLFLQEDAVYPVVFRVISLLKDHKLVEFMNNEDLSKLVLELKKTWDTFFDIPENLNDITVNDVYIRPMEKYCESKKDTNFNECLKKLKSQAFGGQNRFLLYKSIFFAKYCVLIKKGFKFEEPCDMKTFIELLNSIFDGDNMRVIPVSEEIPHDYEILNCFSNDPECYWNTLKYFFYQKIPSENGLSTSRTFILGCFVEKFKQKFPKLRSLLNTRRFNDPDVIKGVFVDTNEYGKIFYKKDILSQHVVGIILEFINSRDINFDCLKNEIIPFLKKKSKFTQFLKIFTNLQSALRVQIKVPKKNKPSYGRFAMIHHLGFEWFCYIRESSDGCLIIQYLDNEPSGLNHKSYNDDKYVLQSDYWKIDNNNIYHNGVKIGYLLDYTKISFDDPNWKEDKSIREIQKYLKTHCRDKVTEEDGKINPDKCKNLDLEECKNFIFEQMDKREKSISQKYKNNEEDEFELKMFSLSLVELMKILKIDPALFTFLDKKSFTMVDFRSNPDIEFPKLKLLQEGTLNIPDNFYIYDGDEYKKCTFESIIKLMFETHLECNECIYCCDPTLPYDCKKWECEHCNNESNSCRKCISEQRRLFEEELSGGKYISSGPFQCSKCGELSRNLLKILGIRCKQIDKIRKGAVACKNHKICGELVCVEELGCFQRDNINNCRLACEKCCKSNKESILGWVCPGCNRFSTHDGKSCNLNVCCLGGYHAHDYVSKEECTHCGEGTDFCGGKFRFNKEVCDFFESKNINVTEYYDFVDYIEIGMSHLRWLKPDGTFESVE